MRRRKPTICARTVPRRSTLPRRCGGSNTGRLKPCVTVQNVSKRIKLKTKTHDIILAALKILNLVLTTAAFFGCYFWYYGHQIIYPFTFKRTAGMILVFFVINYLFTRVYNSLQISYSRIRHILFSQFLSTGMADFTIYAVLCVMSRRVVSPLPGLLCFVAQMIMALIWAVFSNKLYFAIFESAKTAIVHEYEENMDSLIKHYELERKFQVVKTMRTSECLNDENSLEGIDVVFLSNVGSHERNTLLKRCIEKGIRVFVIPGTGDSIMSGAVTMPLFHLPMMKVDRYRPPFYFTATKRILDVLLSALLLVLFSPLMAVIAIIIHATDKGPVFYKQTRLTKNGRAFKLIKFRSMIVNAEGDGIARLSQNDDDRITPIGRFIRKVRIDEIPQLINILKGEMSFIGPRPERPEIAKQYEEEMPEFRLRLQAKAGLTGLAQVYGKYNSTPYEKLQFDLMYIAHPSLLQEVSIFFATVKTVFTPESTEGVAEGQTTAMKKEKKEQKKKNEEATKAKQG